MFLTKLKVALVTGLGASSVAYRAVGQAPAEKRSDGKPPTALEALRTENELLKFNLRVVLEKLRSQEAELLALRGRAAPKDQAVRVWEVPGKRGARPKEQAPR